jgi:DNA-binding PadR family transcriptional regulator
LKAPAQAIDHRLVAGRLSLASQPIRLAILFLLAEGDRNTGAIWSDLGAPTNLGNISTFLTTMRVAGLVEGRRDGRRTFYGLTAAGRTLVERIEVAMALAVG